MVESETQIHTHQHYDQFLASVAAKRQKLEDPQTDRAELDATVEELDRLYTSYVEGSSNARIIDIDAHALRKKAEIIETRTKNLVQDYPGELTLDLMIKALQDRGREAGSGRVVLDKMGQYFVRGSSTAVMAPMLPQIDIYPREVSRRTRQVSDRPTGEAEHAEEGVLNAESDQQTQIIRSKIIEAIHSFHARHPNDELQLDRLVFDKYDHWHTLYNLYDVFAMVHEQELWLTFGSEGSPIVGIYKEGDPVRGHALSEVLTQYAFNLNSKKFAELEALYGKDEPLILNSESER